ncbi:MAG: hypothetical protein WEB00_12605 [Dehalococcoidia bacterium]
MASPSLEIHFSGCVDMDVCNAALFDLTGAAPDKVEVRTTDEIESILARELGKHELSARDREAILTIAGEGLIRECLDQHGHIDSPLLLTSDYVFRRPGMERGLLKHAGLLA